jgi:hypothetical protein
LTGTARKAVSWLSTLQGGAKVEAAYDEIKEELLYSVIDEVQKLGDRVDAHIRDTEAVRALFAVYHEALRSPMTARIQLLAAAFAGFLKPDLGVEQRSRAFRIALQLEPYDIVYLRWLGNGARGRLVENGVQHDGASWDGLTAAGCLAMGEVYDGGETPTYEVTTLGRQVLKLMEDYAGPDTPPSFTSGSNSDPEGQRG